MSDAWFYFLYPIYSTVMIVGGVWFLQQIDFMNFLVSVIWGL